MFLVELTNYSDFSAFLANINEYLSIQMYLLAQPSELAISTVIDNLTNFDILESKHLGNSDMIYFVDFDDANESDIPLEGYITGEDISPPWKI